MVCTRHTRKAQATKRKTPRIIYKPGYRRRAYALHPSRWGKRSAVDLSDLSDLYRIQTATPRAVYLIYLIYRGILVPPQRYILPGGKMRPLLLRRPPKKPIFGVGRRETAVFRSAERKKSRRLITRPSQFFFRPFFVGGGIFGGRNFFGRVEKVIWPPNTITRQRRKKKQRGFSAWAPKNTTLGRLRRKGLREKTNDDIAHTHNAIRDTTIG